MPSLLLRWTAPLLLAFVLPACGEDSGREPRSRPSDLEVLQAAHEDLGLEVPPPDDTAYLVDPFPEAVLEAWFHSEPLRRRLVSRGDWIARVERVENPLKAGEWAVVVSEDNVDLDGPRSETGPYTLRIVARFR